MADREVASLREEVNDIRKRVELVKEAYALRKELEEIKKEIEVIRNKAKEQQKSKEEEKSKAAEEERLKKEKEQKEQQEREKKAREEKERKEREEREKKEREEKERREREEKEKKEKEERIKKENEERARLEREKKEREEKEKKEREEKERLEKEAKAKQQQQQAASKSTSAPAAVSVADKYEEERRRQLEIERNAVLNAKYKEIKKPETQQLGMHKELEQQRLGKYDPKLEAEARDWIEQVTGEKLNGSFADALKSGVVLCKLVNKIKPNSAKKINNMKMAFAMMENINTFLSAAREIGVPQEDLFMTVDLFEEKNMNQVVLCIHSLGRACRRISSWTGPTIGAKLADKHEVKFSDETLKKGQNQLNYAQRTQADTQKIVSDFKKPGLDSVIRSKSTGTPTNQLNLLEKNKTEVQKDASAARKQGHNIIK